MSTLSLQLSDGLLDLSRLLRDFEHEPKILDPEDARSLREIVCGLRLQARTLENEVSRHRWNEAARRDARQADPDEEDVVAALTAAGGNVVAFPGIRAAFSDGRAEPREWR